MLVCPECQGELVHNATDYGYSWTCPRCSGQVIGLAVLRKEAGDEFAQRVGLEARRAQGGLGRPCPMCSNYLVKITMGGGTEAYDLEVCRVCQSAWVSQAACRRLPLASPPPSAVTTPAAASSSPTCPLPAQTPGYTAPSPGQTSPPPASMPQQGNVPGPTAIYQPAQSGPSDRTILTAEQQERIAAVYAQTMANPANQMKSRYDANPSAPEALWQKIAGYLGMPVIVDADLSNTPLVTYGLGVMMALVSLFALYATDMNDSVQNLAFIPAQPFRFFGTTFLTSFLLHGGWTHLLGNLYFLAVFGSCVEDRLGQGKYLALILVATVVGDALHTALDPHSEIPLIGASGGIAGLVVFFGLAFPRARMAFVFFFFRWVRIPALAFVLFWLLSQIFGARSQIAGYSDVAYLAHLGGALVGFVFWLAWRFTKEEDEDVTATPAGLRKQAV